jgi:uncharacterized protein
VSTTLPPPGTDFVVGWRTWTLRRHRLVSLSQIVWEPGRPLRAECRRESSGVVMPGSWVWWGEPVDEELLPMHGPCPAESCTCGVYAWETPSSLNDEGRVVGSVFLWGGLIRDNGLYRAEFAYPRELYVAKHLIRSRVFRRVPRFLREYGVPVHVVRSYAELTAQNPLSGRRRLRSAGGELGILPVVLPLATSAHSAIHGVQHWKRVARLGRELVRETPGADLEVIEAFAALHDSQRLADRNDPEHGARAALLARELCREGVLDLDGDRLETLCYALHHHDRGEVTTSPTIGCAWDADRLDLPRVGIRPDAALLSTAAARKRVERDASPRRGAA